MFRTARPFLSLNPQRLGLVGRAPDTFSGAARNLRTSGYPNLLSQKVHPRRTAPLISRAVYSTQPPLQPNIRDKGFEKEVSKKILEARPGEVTTQSSVRHVLEESQGPRSTKDTSSSLHDELNVVKDTFNLKAVPRYPYNLGLAGTLPYLGTSLATVYLSWDLNTDWPSTSTFVNNILIPHDTAAYWLHLLEPIQVGYGAVIISFLGAIHWGLEFAEKQASHNRTRFRYSVGVLAPIIAWPTVFMPVEWALTSQFLAFTTLYLADSRATTRGWAPQWYGTYRWVLTAVVGLAVFVSLVGRAKVGEDRARLRSGELRELLRQKTAGADKEHNWAKEEEEERARLKKEKKEEEKKRKEEERKRKAAEQEKSDKKKEIDEKDEDSDEKGGKADGGEKK